VDLIPEQASHLLDNVFHILVYLLVDFVVRVYCIMHSIFLFDA